MPEHKKNSTGFYSTNISVYQVNHIRYIKKFKGNCAVQVEWKPFDSSCYSILDQAFSTQNNIIIY